ncbi:hypothetical protein M9Y38_09825 [Escherichia coli]|nr:hypothetical protein [Escherichia coli]
MMDLTQISLRTSRDQVERIKTYAKASNLSVNAFLVNLIENSLNNIANDGTQSELTRLVAEPVKTLSRLHHKICDPWNTNEPADLTPAEIAFLTDAARKQLDSKHLAGPDYFAIRDRIDNTLIESSLDYYQDLFGFAHRFYIRDEESRRTFATEHAPVGIQSVDYSFTVGNKTFTIIVRVNDSNSFDTPEDNRPPVLAFTCESAQFDTRHDWDTFIALVRLMNAVHNGEESKCHAGTHTRLGRRMDSDTPWSLFLGRLQLLLKDSELKDMAVEFHKLVNGDAANVIKQIRLLYGEG